LSLSGHSIHYASDGAEAVRLAKKLRPDVVFLDIRMPVMNGYDACHQLRQCHELDSTRIFALTAERGADHESRCLRERFDAQLAKPLDIAKLTTLL
jgi:CheY-like chemotaxis protein